MTRQFIGHPDFGGLFSPYPMQNFVYNFGDNGPTSVVVPEILTYSLQRTVAEISAATEYGRNATNSDSPKIPQTVKSDR